MKFHLDGKYTVNSPVDKTFESLTTPAFMVSCIPDLQSNTIHDSDHFDAKIRVGISLVKGTVDMKFALQDKQPPSHAKLIGDGSGAGSKMHIESVFDLSPNGNSTLVIWSADADLSGLIAGIGGSVLKGQSEKQVNQIFYNIKSKLEA
ncbi:MAG: carbon monoxide dehydrogenase subunit G [archaeon]|nr:carbon monoxide dehydrogenase subunit G [archaeon]